MRAKFVDVQSGHRPLEIRFRLYEETLGITRLALTSLRDELARVNCQESNVVVLLVPALDASPCECYGVAIVEPDLFKVTLIGDGFRGDGGGEGGKGHRAAWVLFALFGVVPLEFEHNVDFVADVGSYDQFVMMAWEVAKVAKAEKLTGKEAQYIDWCRWSWK